MPPPAGDFPPCPATAGDPVAASGPIILLGRRAWYVQCYYRDDRVMKAIGMERRPPFPLGFQVETGDLSLLEPVRARGKKYRDAVSRDDER